MIKIGHCARLNSFFANPTVAIYPNVKHLWMQLASQPALAQRFCCSYRRHWMFASPVNNWIILKCLRECWGPCWILELMPLKLYYLELTFPFLIMVINGVMSWIFSIMEAVKHLTCFVTDPIASELSSGCWSTFETLMTQEGQYGNFVTYSRTSSVSDFAESHLSQITLFWADYEQIRWCQWIWKNSYEKVMKLLTIVPRFLYKEAVWSGQTVIMEPMELQLITRSPCTC